MNRELNRFLSISKSRFREPDGMIPDLFLSNYLDSVPEKSGAYIFLSQEQKFIYPNGESQVIYIGTSSNLNSRFRTHHKVIKEINSLPKSKILDKWYYSRHHYLNTFGCKAFWYTTRGSQKEKNLESLLFEKFYDKFYSLPVGNGAFSFKK